jgi:phytoene dehydrogenase-like protein
MSKLSYDTIVVGGGMAGLTATAYLAQAGQRVLLIEKNSELGGLVNTFSRDGFVFDAGVRALESAGIIIPMLKDLKIQLDVVKSPVSLGIEDQILHLDGSNSLTGYSDFLKHIYPDSKDEIDQLLKTIRKVMKHMEILYGIENPVFKDLKRDPAYIFRKLLPWLPRFLFTIGKINRMQYPVEEYLQTFVSNASLRDIISQHFFTNTPAFFALSYFSLYLDYIYPKGGVGKLAEAMRDKILALGAQIKTDTLITQLSVTKKTVMDEAKTHYRYKNLVWAADLKTLYKIADLPMLPPAQNARYELTKAKVLKARGGQSVFTIFVQVQEELASFASIAHGHFFYTPSRQGLGEIHRRKLKKLLANFDEITKPELCFWLDQFISQNTFEISIPGLKDESTVPPGKTGLIISFLAEYELFKKVQDAGWLEEFTHEIEERVLRVLADTVYPMLKDKVIAHFSFSPINIKNRIASSEGAIVGWEFGKDMPVINKIQHANRAVLTPFPSIYQAGQWAYSPAGVPMSILTGKLAANKILSKPSCVTTTSKSS